MKLITILLVLATEKYWRSIHARNRFDLLNRMSMSLRSSLEHARWFDGSLGVLLVISPAVFLIAVIQYYLGHEQGALIWVLSLLFSVAVLLACIGEKRFSGHVNKYLDAWQKDDLAEACLQLNKITVDPVAFENPRQLNHRFMAVLLGRLNERLLAILFWFVVLGPMGAILYRSVTQLKGLTREQQENLHGFHAAARYLKIILDWLPARLTALGYAVIGDFVHAIHSWKEHSEEWSHDVETANKAILTCTGIGALDLHDFYLADDDALSKEQASEHVRTAQALIKRTAVAWLTVLAILTLVGWLS